MKHAFNLNQKRGIALILTVMTMTMILLLAVYVLTSTLTEGRIAKSQSWGAKTYYLAEAGIQEMVWKLKNDAAFKTNFQTNPAWIASFTRTDPFGASSGSYTVTIVNSGLAGGEITATSSIAIESGKNSQRLIKTKVYRLIGLSGMGTNAIANGNGDFTILNSDLVEITGDLYSNSAIDMGGSKPSFGIVNGSLITTGSIDEGNGDLNVSGATKDENSVPAPTPMALPGVDFGSLQSQANAILANDAALDATSTVNGIIWVNTAADIEQNMTINGLLVVNGNLSITNSAVITVNHIIGYPSGLIVNGNLTISKSPLYNGNIIINGLIYATGSITLEKLNTGYTFLITGGITSGNGILIKNCLRTIQIVYDNEILVTSLTSSSNSPVIAVEHWEEEY